MHDSPPTKEYLDMLRRLEGQATRERTVEPGPSPANRKKRRAERARRKKARR